MIGGSLKPHSKSRAGCRTCKRRKVKCDGRGPVCRNCEKRQDVCEYTDLMDDPPVNPQTRTSQPTQNQAEDSEMPKFDPPPHFHLTFRELELLHHWTTETSLTMGVDPTPEMQHIWQVDTPKMALRFPFLMHSLLALSAAHIVHTRPTENTTYSFLPLARRHHAHASALFRDASSSGIDKIKSSAVVTFSILTMLTSMALLFPSSDEGQNLDEFIRWVLFLHTSLRFARPIVPTLSEDASMATLLAHLHLVPDTQLNFDPDVMQSLQIIDASVHSSSASAAEKDTYLEAVDQTRKWFALMTPPPSMAYIGRWAGHVSPEFLVLLTRKEPLALSLMAHWLVPLHNAARGWVFQDWPERVLSTIQKKLDGERVDVIEWPMQNFATKQ